MRYALIDATGKVANVLELDPQAEYPLPDGCQLVPDEEGFSKIGGRYADDVFLDPDNGGEAARLKRKLRRLDTELLAMAPVVARLIEDAAIENGVTAKNEALKKLVDQKQAIRQALAQLPK